MVNHPNRSQIANTTWKVRFHEYFTVCPGGGIRPPENTYLEFTGTRTEAIARYDVERAARSNSVQVTLYRPRGEGRHGEGQRVREARGTERHSR